MVPRVSDALATGAIVVRPPWHSFEEGVQGLVDALVAEQRLSAALAAEAVRSILEREAIASTAVVEIGLSIPHARLDGVRGVLAALAVSPTAVFYAHAEVPITIMALVLSSPALTGEQLNFLSALSMLVQSSSTRGALQAAHDAAAVIDVIRTQERVR